jgi:uncharacterized phage infection (PIP) family protein YhgE
MLKWFGNKNKHQKCDPKECLTDTANNLDEKLEEISLEFEELLQNWADQMDEINTELTNALCETNKILSDGGLTEDEEKTLKYSAHVINNMKSIIKKYCSVMMEKTEEFKQKIKAFTDDIDWN